LLKNFVEGVAVVEVLAAPLGPKVVQNEGAEDVDRLHEVGKVVGVVGVEARRVVFAFEGGLSEQDEWPDDGDVLRSLSFLPYSLEHTLGVLRGRAVQKAMLGGLRDPGVACVAGGRDSHHLQPGPSWETLVEG
jgi:hypothetical protein